MESYAGRCFGWPRQGQSIRTEPGILARYSRSCPYTGALVRPRLVRMSRYHGNVTVGGPPDVRELTHLVITKVAVGSMANNTYVLRCRDSGEQLLVDAANEARTLLRLVADGLGQVLTTHRHRDHWLA